LSQIQDSGSKALLKRAYFFLHGPPGFRVIRPVGEERTIVEDEKEATAGQDSDNADGNRAHDPPQIYMVESGRTLLGAERWSKAKASRDFAEKLGTPSSGLLVGLSLSASSLGIFRLCSCSFLLAWRSRFFCKSLGLPCSLARRRGGIF